MQTNADHYMSVIPLTLDVEMAPADSHSHYVLKIPLDFAQLQSQLDV